MEPNSPQASPPYVYEDLYVGQRFTSGTRLIEQDEIIAFAKQFDPQPFHTDPAAAKLTLFQGLVASGWHTAAMTMRLLIDSGLSIDGGMVGAGGELTWPRPTRPGYILQVETEVVELRPSRSRPDRGLATIRSETKNQQGEVLQILFARLVVPRRIQLPSA
jgi:acyl dehydratase